METHSRLQEAFTSNAKGLSLHSDRKRGKKVVAALLRRRADLQWVSVERRTPILVLAEAIKDGFCRKLRRLDVEIDDPQAFKSLCDALNSTSSCPRLD